MIITTLPDPYCAGTPTNETGTGNTVVYASTNSKYCYPTHATPYLFITNYLSEGSYAINNQPVTVNDKIFYLLEPGSNLAINFKTANPLQTLFILFDERFITNIIHQQTTPADALMNNPEDVCKKDIHLPTVPFIFNTKLQSMLNSLRQNNNIQGGQLHNILQNIVTEFCFIHAYTARQIQKLNAVKTTTREELYRRLTTAKLFMQDNACNVLTVDEIAKTACLNSFHFLRMFKQAYHTTPHQYLLQLKLEKASELLKSQKQSVTDVCAMVGFESIGSFSNLFKKSFGVTPSSLLKE